ncbi:SCO family protein [Sulfitobacter sp. JB4-11]|uniref:SCO family protein n=1 Tax=Sulfitobacter rhodophyticola TaxID=3238304 RepID=UPI003515D096
MDLLRLCATLALVILAWGTPATAEKLDAEIAFEQSQAAIGNQTAAHVLRDHRGRDLPLEQFRGKPLVVSLVYTSCASVCPLVTDHLRSAVLESRDVLGAQSFDILTFGFDASGDRPGQLAGFAGTHKLLEIDGWQIASAEEAVTEALLSDLGFSFRAAAGGYAHVTQTTILDSEGKVYRQVYGQSFPLPMLFEPLKELVLGRTTRSFAADALWDRLTFLCTVYDPLTGAYRFDYAIVFGMFFGALSLILMGWVILRLWLERRRAQKERLTVRGRKVV